MGNGKNRLIESDTTLINEDNGNRNKNSEEQEYRLQWKGHI